MPLELKRRKGSKHWYMRGTVRGQPVFESTGTHDKALADSIRIKREARLLNDSVYGAQLSVTFAEAALSYLGAGGSKRFLGELVDGKWTGLIGRFYDKRMHTITQNDLDAAANTLYPNTQFDTRNRQCYTPFIAVWNHSVSNKWAEHRKWNRPRKPKATVVTRLKAERAGTKPISFDRAAKFVLGMSPAPAMVMTALFYTGMRPIELFALDARVDDIRPKDRWLVLASSKTGEPRGVPLHDFIVPLFEALLTRGGRLFRTPNGEPYPISDNPDERISGQLKTAIKGARTRTGETGISAYTARHTVSTQLVMNGVHGHIKDQILGHAVTDMSRHYTSVPQEPLIAAINTLPVPEAWRAATWMADPIGHAHRLVAGAGARTDLIRAKSVQDNGASLQVIEDVA